ncbi:MAG: glycerol-3-phosphate 1-O-acyltransferase PlsY [Bacteroidota bacterium]
MFQTNDLLVQILVFLLSYLIGSITTGDIVAYFKNVDLRGQGSGSIGATNVFRAMGWFYAAVVLIGDALKGIIAVILGGKLIGNIGGFDFAILSGIAAIIGHNWPIYTRFRGGKGIATSLGVIIGLTSKSLLIVLPVWIIAFVLSGFVSLASILAALSYPISVFISYNGDYYKLVFAAVTAILAVYRHKSNLQRLFQGKEHRILYNKRKGADKG